MLRRNMKRFRGGHVSKAHRLVYHSTLGSRVMKKKRDTDFGENEMKGVPRGPATVRIGQLWPIFYTAGPGARSDGGG